MNFENFPLKPETLDRITLASLFTIAACLLTEPSEDFQMPLSPDVRGKIAREDLVKNPSKTQLPLNVSSFSIYSYNGPRVVQLDIDIITGSNTLTFFEFKKLRHGVGIQCYEDTEKKSGSIFVADSEIATRLGKIGGLSRQQATVLGSAFIYEGRTNIDKIPYTGPLDYCMMMYMNRLPAAPAPSARFEPIL